MNWMERDHWLVPDTSRHEQGFGGKRYTPAELTRIEERFVRRGDSDGPRFQLRDTGRTSDDKLTLPPGYEAVNHPNNRHASPDAMDAEAIASPDDIPAGLRRHFEELKLPLDSLGRACHPHAIQLLTNFGMQAGRGFYRWFGGNTIVDAIAIDDDGSFIVTSNGKRPVLPGGHSIPTDFGVSNASWKAGDRPVTIEGIFATAVRKLDEETGFVAPDGAKMEIVRAIRQVTHHTKLNAWQETYTVRIMVGLKDVKDTKKRKVVTPQDSEVLGAMWFDHQRAYHAALRV
jgi:hypothetical protein